MHTSEPEARAENAIPVIFWEIFSNPPSAICCITLVPHCAQLYYRGEMKTAGTLKMDEIVRPKHRIHCCIHRLRPSRRRLHKGTFPSTPSKELGSILKRLRTESPLAASYNSTPSFEGCFALVRLSHYPESCSGGWEMMQHASSALVHTSQEEWSAKERRRKIVKPRGSWLPEAASCAPPVPGSLISLLIKFE